MIVNVFCVFEKVAKTRLFKKLGNVKFLALCSLRNFGLNHPYF